MESKLKRLSAWSLSPIIENTGFQADLRYCEWHVGIIIAVCVCVCVCVCPPLGNTSKQRLQCSIILFWIKLLLWTGFDWIHVANTFNTVLSRESLLISVDVHLSCVPSLVEKLFPPFSSSIHGAYIHRFGLYSRKYLSDFSHKCFHICVED